MLHLLYWKIRKILLNIRFFFKKGYYKTSTRLSMEKTVFSVQKYVYIEVPKQLGINLLLFALTLWLDKLALQKFSNLPAINETLVSDILIAMVGIAGVFLGLYCSYIATVFSSKYVNAPQEISNLFRDDLINSKSTEVITNYIIYSIILLISNLLFKNLGIVSILTNMLMAIFAVVSYVHVGRRILGMSNTYFVAEKSYRIFQREFKRISKHKLFAQDENFQNHAKKVARKNIETLKIINSYNLNSSEIKTVSLFNFMYNNLIVLYSYLEIKKHIPYNSRWFLSSEYKKWYKATDTEIGIALNTGTFLKNNDSTDVFWFEKELLKINDPGFEELINSKEYDLVLKYIACLENFLSLSIDNFNTKFWVEYIQKLQNQVSNCIVNDKCDNENEILLCESLLATYLQFAIDTKKFVYSFNVSEVLEQSVHNTCFTHAKYSQIYNSETTDRLYTGIAAEQKIENKRITPDWYIKQNIAKQIYNIMEQLCDSVRRANDSIIKFAQELHKGKKHIAATLVYTKYIEWYHKIFDSLDRLGKILAESKEHHKEIPNFIWDEYDFNTFVESINEAYINALVEWSNCAMLFTIENWENYDEFPDMLGSCYNNVCNFLIQAISNNDYDAFKKTYPSLWGIVTLYQELSRKELSKIKEPFKRSAVLAVLCNPILDFGNISGYAYMWGEISGNESWKTFIEASFSQVVEKLGDKKDFFCEQISTCFSIPSSLGPAIYNRADIHMSWKMSVERAFLNSGYLEWERKGFYEVLKTDCLWLKKLIGTRSDYELLSSDGFEVFGVLVLNKHLSQDKQFRSRWGWEKDA